MFKLIKHKQINGFIDCKRSQFIHFITVIKSPYSEDKIGIGLNVRNIANKKMRVDEFIIGEIAKSGMIEYIYNLFCLKNINSFSTIKIADKNLQDVFKGKTFFDYNRDQKSFVQNTGFISSTIDFFKTLCAYIFQKYTNRDNYSTLFSRKFEIKIEYNDLLYEFEIIPNYKFQQLLSLRLIEEYLEITNTYNY